MSFKLQQQKNFRKGFTLVELLVAVSIIGIMGSMVLFALLGAQNDAKVARTRGTIQKINEIVLQKWEEYRYKPVNIGTLPPNVQPREAARLRMIVERDAMRMEMPDRVSDLLYPPTQYTTETFVAPGPPVAGKIDRRLPHGYGILYTAFRNQIIALQAHPDPKISTKWSGFLLAPLPANPIPAFDPVAPLSSNPIADWTNAVESSELLYLFVSTCNFGGSTALEYFKPTEVGDSDEDGLLEFVDAWERPISWIRWPAGYPGDLVRYADSDAMDPAKTDWRYRTFSPPIPADWQPRTLVPLIVSGGADGQYGITFDFTEPVVYATMTWPSSPANIRGVSGSQYTLLPYYYPDPFFTWDYSSVSSTAGNPHANPANGPSSGIPAPETDANGYRYNQLGSIPTVGAEFAADNITSHDIILEP